MTFDRDARAALADGQLRGALRQATTLSNMVAVEGL